jgi:hypothetical protein
MEGSMGAGGWLSPAGTRGAELGSTRNGLFATVRFMLHVSHTEGRMVRIDTFGCWGFSSDETFPSFVAFLDDFKSILLVLTLSAKSEGILLLAIRDLPLAIHTQSLHYGGRRWYLVDSPEFIRCTEKSREMSFDIFDVIKFGSERIIHVNSDEFPICFSLVEKCHCSKNFDLFDLSWISDFFANLADINWVIVTFCLGFRMCMIWILPCL